MKKLQSWDVYVNGQFRDTVYLPGQCPLEEVRRSLMNDGRYGPTPEVRLGRHQF